MRYNLAEFQEVIDAKLYLKKLADQKAPIELKRVVPTRSLKSNAYLHLLLQICGSEWGYSLAEIKTIWKREIAANIFIYYKNDKPFIRSSADLDSKEMTNSIEQLKKYAAEQGLDLPEPDDTEKLEYYERQISKYEKYL